MNTSTSPTALESITVETASDCDACIIWLHGLGADGHDFAGIVPQLQLPSDAKWRFIFPHAPKRPVTINGGAVMRAWYDIYSLGDLNQEDWQGLQQGQQALIQLIDEQCQAGIASQRIVLAGFSQGGALALYTGLRYPTPLAGLLILSSYLPAMAKLADQASESNKQTAIFQAHGEFDEVLPCVLGEHTANLLTALDYQVTWQRYPMAHQVCAAEIADISAWLTSHLRPTSAA